MASERSYYDLLGVPRDSDASAIEAAYHGRSLRFRVGLFDDRPRDLSAPTREEIETAYATLRDPEQRARYDAVLFGLDPPQAGAPARKPWLPWAIVGLLLVLVALAAAGIAATARSQSAPRDPVSRILGSDQGARATLTARAVAAAVSPTPARAVASATAPVATPIAPSAQSPAAVAAAATSPAPTVTTSPPASASSTATTTPPATVALAPTATAPPATSTPLMATPTAVPTPVPTPFPATDRIGTAMPVNLREGPGTNFASLGALPRGTLLAATGAMRTVGGILWREFRLAGGAQGWIRDMDVLPVP